MFNIIKRVCTRRLGKNFIVNCLKTNHFYSVYLCPKLAESRWNSICQRDPIPVQCYRYTTKKSKFKKEDSNSDTDESDKDFLDDIQDKHTKIIKVSVTSLRLDVILKAGLAVSRNKLESIFYDSKIRLNGEKILKKSVHVQEGDEIDVIKGNSIDNKNFLTVARIEVLSTVGKEDKINVKIRRYKVLTVENYQGKNRWEE